MLAPAPAKDPRAVPIRDGDRLLERAQSTMARLLSEGREVGAQLCIFLDGEPVVSVCGGSIDSASGEAVTSRTLFPVFSVSKGIASTLVHILADQGRLDDTMMVVDVWPEYGCNGKERTTLKNFLVHTAGLPHLPPDLTFAESLDWDTVVGRLAEMRPESPPGSVYAYHAKTFGWLVGEVLQRTQGKPFERILYEEITRPLGLDGLFIGYTGDDSRPVALLEEANAASSGRPSLERLGSLGADQPSLCEQMNCPDAWKACMPGTNGLMTAFDIARHYAATLPSGAGGVRLLSERRLARATAWCELNDAHRNSVWQGLGYQPVTLELPDGRTLSGFGHGGYGGSMGAAFPAQRLAFGYTRNLLGVPSWPEWLSTTLNDSNA